MKVYKEVDANSFEFWSGARDTIKYLTSDEVEQIFNSLEELYPDGADETEVNDFFWFEDDTIAEWLGWSDFETLMKARSDGLWCKDEDEYNDFLEEDEGEDGDYWDDGCPIEDEPEGILDDYALEFMEHMEEDEGEDEKEE